MNWKQFVHWSPTEIHSIVDKYDSEELYSFKPSGLFFANGNEWLDFCKVNYFNRNKYRYCYRIESLDESFILQLGQSNYRDFISKYGLRNDNISYIDWDQIKGEYKGFYLSDDLIRPSSIANFDFSAIWSSFDVETLVIWDRNVASISRIEDSRNFLNSYFSKL